MHSQRRGAGTQAAMPAAPVPRNCPPSPRRAEMTGSRPRKAVQSIPVGCVRTPEPCGQRGEPEPLMTLQLKSDKAAAMMAE